MMVRTANLILAAAAVLGASSVAASAYFVDAPGAAARAGSVTSFTLRSGALDAGAEAIRARLAAIADAGDARAKRDAAGVSAFYAARDYHPVWIDGGELGAVAGHVVARLAAAAADGLNPADYALPALALGSAGLTTPDRLAEADVELSLAVARFARHAYSGRLEPSAISGYIDITPTPPDSFEVLAKVSSSADPAAALSDYNPTHSQFVRLRAALADIRAAAAAAVAQVTVPDGAALKLGVSEERVALLRTRLAIATPSDDPTLFDEVVRDAVIAFQAAHGLTADGVVGRNTLAAMNGQGANREGEIVANMERWRWLPHDLGRFHVQVNIPEFMLTVRKDGEVAFTTRVVVGKTTTQTPIFYDEIELVVVNPYWNVPQSIIAGEMMPQLRSNPGAVGGYEVFARVNGQTQRVDPWAVNWNDVSPRSVSIRQPPGAGNALGTVKFLFPNSHDVYLHDTPSKSLFQRDVRAFSHGCVRVQNPWDFAAALLQEEANINVASLERLVGNGRESGQRLDHHVPVYLTYFTASVDDAGELQLKNDLYGHSAKVRAALGY